MPRPRAYALLAAAALLALAACTGSGGDGNGEPGAAASPSASPSPAGPSPASPSPEGSSPTTTPTAGPTTPATPRPTAPAGPSGTARVRVAGTIAQGLDAPWGLAFLPGGAALVSERDSGLVKRIDPGGRVRVVGEVPGVDGRTEGGLLGIAVARDFARSPWLYAYFTAGEENRVVRMRYAGGRLGRPEVLIDGIAAAGIHNGGRLAFGPDGMLYAGTGDAGDRPLSQDRRSLNGKILRLAPDGRVPAGNPFPGSPVWSFGHRNVQGLAWDARGRLWASEFGQNTWDELNLIRPGGNYGWPEVEGRGGAGRGFVDPVAQWRPSEASPSGVAVAGDGVYVAGLRGERLWQVPAGGGAPRALFTERFGRLRTVARAPDGSLWLVTSNTDGRTSPRPGDDRVLRLALS